MFDEVPEILELARAVSDHQPLDWALAERSAQDPKIQAVIRELSLIAKLSHVHRQAGRTFASPAAAPATGPSATVEGGLGTWAHLRLLQRVGSGAFGTVFRAWDSRLGREVALKILTPSLAWPVEASAFVREGALLARVRHPHVVTVFGAETVAGEVGIWMEFVRGRTLSQVVEDDGVLSAEEAALIGVTLCRAVAAVHNAGLLHRDIKAQNVMREKGGRIVLMDFGLGRDITAIVPEGSVANTAGTPLCLAPELLRGGAPSVASDVYSLGVLLYFLVTGTYPVRGRSIAEIRAAHEQGTRKLLHDVRANLPPPFVATVERALAPDPSHRFRTCGAMEAALGSVMGAERHSHSTLAEADQRSNQGKDGAPPRTAAGDPAGPYPSSTDLTGEPQRIASTVPSVIPHGWRVRPVLWSTAALALAAAIAAPWLLTRSAPPPSTAGPEAPVATTGAQVRLGVLPARNLAGRRDVDEWPALVQALFTGELTGVANLGVMDPLSLNGRLEPALKAGGGAPNARLLQLVRDAGVDLLLDSHLVPAETAYQLQANIVDTESGEVRFSTTRVAASNERDLPRAVGALANEVVSYLQLGVFRLERDRDLAPWISLREHNIEAVKAFAQANQYVYRFQRKEVEGYLRRAIGLDRAFIGPRVWLISSLISEGRRTEAEQQFNELRQLQDTASPFDQTMISYIGARLGGDRGAEIRHLEVALRYSPGNNILLVNLGEVRAETGDCAGALADLAAPVQMKWEFPSLYAVWGWCAIQEGHVEEARRVLTESLAWTSTNPYVYAMLEALEVAIGSEPAAVRYAELYATRLRELNRQSPREQLVTLYERLSRYCRENSAPDRAALLARKAETLKANRPVR